MVFNLTTQQILNKILTQKLYLLVHSAWTKVLIKKCGYRSLIQLAS